MGEGNWKIARKDRPIRLIDRPLEIGGLENPPTLVFSAQPGPATLVSLVSLAATDTGCDLPARSSTRSGRRSMPYFHFKPDTASGRRWISGC